MASISRSLSSSEAVMNAEALFESKTIVDIREVEAKTKRDVEDKKKQLRRLVGDSYRDLIESADKIVAIAKSCDTILFNVTNVQDAFSKLSGSITTTTWSGGEKKESLKRHEELYAVGSRVKYLVDTPEMIWGCLDAQNYLEAARRYLRAEEVHRLLQTSFSAELLGRFPLLSHQWPQVLKFKQQILAAVRASLAASTLQPTAQVADALAAAAALESLDSAAALQLLLGSRQAMMAQLLGSGPEEESVEAVGKLLSTWAGVMQQSVTQVAELFLQKDGREEGTLLQQALRQAEQQESSGLFYAPAASGREGGADARSGLSPEAVAWGACQKTIESRLLPQASGQVEQACSSWVAQLGQELLPSAALLLGICKEAADLCEVERVLRAAIAAWSKPSDRSRPNGTSAADRGGSGQSWEVVCEWVLGRPLNAWQELFHLPILTRAKEIISASFDHTRAAVAGPIEACLQAAAAADPEPAGRVACPSWPQFAAAVEPTPSGPDSAAAAASSTPPQAASINGLPSGFRQDVHLIRQHFDTHLQSTLSCCLLLLDNPTALPSAPAPDTSAPPYFPGMSPMLLRHSSMGPPHLSGRDPLGRASDLEPFIQQQCAQMATSLAQLLHEKFTSLPPADPTNVQAARTIEQVLLVARLCLALSADSRGLQLLLGPPDAWRPQAPGSTLMPPHSLGGSRVPKAGHQSAKLKALIATFTATANAAFRQWAQWAAASLGAQLHGGFLRDEVLRLNVVPMSWSQTVLGGTGDGEEMLEEGGGDMRFSLPACPSVPAFVLLDAACREMRRAGGHTLGNEALQVFEWELMGEVLKVLRTLLEDGSAFSSLVSEKGVLQLLFDLRFIRDVLAGGRPLLPRQEVPSTALLLEVQDPAATAAVSERRRECAALEMALQERLDPIDWATYEPYLWANVERHYHRCAVLLGALVHLQRAYSEAAGKVQPTQDINPLNLLPAPARFQYLPISAPSQLSLQSSQPRSASAQLFSKLGAHPSSLDETYSFANLGRTRDSGSATGSAASGSGTDPNSAASTLGALQARLQASNFGTLGSMLGDKAAEMTAMAQQRFETISLDLSGGLLSSFAKGVVRAPTQ